MTIFSCQEIVRGGRPDNYGPCGPFRFSISRKVVRLSPSRSPSSGTIRRRGSPARLLEHLEIVASRHHQVGQDDVDLVLAQQGDRLVSRASGVEADVGPRKDVVLRQIEDVRAVFRDEDCSPAG